MRYLNNTILLPTIITTGSCDVSLKPRKLEYGNYISQEMPKKTKMLQETSPLCNYAAWLAETCSLILRAAEHVLKGSACMSVSSQINLFLENLAFINFANNIF